MGQPVKKAASNGVASRYTATFRNRMRLAVFVLGVYLVLSGCFFVGLQLGRYVESITGEVAPQARNSAGKCTNGPYILDQNSHLEGMGSTFQHRKYSLILAAALDASWIGTLHNKHTYDKRAKEGENYAHSYFGLGDPNCSIEDLKARAAELDFVHFQRPKDSNGEYFVATEGTHRFPSIKSLCRSVETGTLPVPWMTPNTVVAMKYKSRPRESYNYCLFNSRFRRRFERRQRERHVRTRGRDELWISVHFRWGDVEKWSTSVESPNKRAGAGLSEYINEARLQMDKQRGHNKTIAVHFFSEGNATLFAKFQDAFPNAEMHINGDWRDSLDILTQSNVLIGGQSGFFVVAAHLCDGCTVVTASPSNRKFQASSVEKNLTNYRPVIGFSKHKQAEADDGSSETGGLSLAEAKEEAEGSQSTSQKVAVPAHNAFSAVDDGSALASHCGVLVTSQGGVGSSAFIRFVEDIVKRRPEALALNFPNDSDKFKHKPATYWKHHDKRALVGTLKVSDRITKVCFKKVLVIIGDPIHTIESTYRRFKTKHLNKLRVGSGREKYAKSTKLATIYKEIADSGADEVGISNYIESWRAAQQDREQWPEIRLVTSKTLYNNAVDMAEWIGVEGDELEPFEGLSYQESKHHEVKVEGVDEATMEKVKKVYQSVIDIVEAVDNGLE